MNNDQFQNVREMFLSKSAELLDWKGKDYAGSGDKLYNFKRRAKLLGLTPSQVCVVDLSKHIDCIFRMVFNNEYLERWTWEEDGRENLKIKIVDAINYLFLLAANIDDELEVKK